MENNNIKEFAQKSNYKIKDTYDVWVVKVQFQRQDIWPLGSMFPYGVFLYADGSLYFRGVKIGSLTRNLSGNYSIQINENTLTIVEEMDFSKKEESRKEEKELIKKPIDSQENVNDFEFSFRDYPTADEILNSKKEELI